MHRERWGMCGCVGVCVWACWTADLQHELWPWSEPGAIKGNLSMNQPPSGFLRAFPPLQWSVMLNFWVPILNELNTLIVSHSQCFSCMSETRVWFYSCILMYVDTVCSIKECFYGNFWNLLISWPLLVSVHPSNKREILSFPHGSSSMGNFTFYSSPGLPPTRSITVFN